MDGEKQKTQKSSAPLEAALKAKDFEYSLELLEEVLATTPDAIEPLLAKTHLLALKGKVSLSEYRQTMESILQRLESEAAPSVPVGKKVLRGIQYSCAGRERIELIQRFLESIKETLRDNSKGSRRLHLLLAEVYLALDDLAGFVGTVEELSTWENPPKAVATLERIARKCVSPCFPDITEEKVFGIGLSRTATSSLNRALKSLGYTSIHWMNPHTQTIITSRDFDFFDAFTDIPVSYQFEALYDRYPHAKFVYTTRKRDSWIESISTHYRNSRGVTSPAELIKPDIAQRFHGTAGPVEENLYTPHETWGDAFDHFDHRVRNYFSDKQGGRFLELGITEGEGWDTLCPFLDKAIPEEPFPNVNKRPRKVTTSDILQDTCA